MADVTLQVHYITSGLGGGGNYLTGQYIRVIADGPAIRAELWDAGEGGNFISNPSGGPNLDGTPSNITVSSGSFTNAQYCDGSDLVYFNPQIDWPYANYNLSEDHPFCAVIVCDLEITGFVAMNESTIGASDGQVALTATSSNGVIKYSLIPDFNYVSQGLDSPLTGFGTGNYIVYAKDSSGCTDQINVFVGIDYTYGVRWRLDYETFIPQNFFSRIDIEERDYVGPIVETCGGENPFLLEYNPDEDSQLVPSMATIELMVEQGEDGKFDDIRRGYDRQFIVKKYKSIIAPFDEGDLFLEWTGYITPEFYSEPYISDPYPITLKAIDGLGELQTKNFVQLSGEEYFGDMSIIQIVAECLNKLPVKLHIRSCVNIYEENMLATAADDPLAQTFIKSQNFLTKKCETVLTSLLKPFTRAELFQSYGVWWIRTKEQAVYSSLPYREFDITGTYLSNSSIAARKNADSPTVTDRFCWSERSQLLAYSRNYGKFKITHSLDKDNNMIDSGGFEVEDIDLSTEFFRDWSIFPAQTLVSSGLEYVDQENSSGAFFFQWSASSSDQADNILMSVPLPISFAGDVFKNKGTNFKLKFKVYISPSIPGVQWIRLGWKLRFTDTDTGDFWDWYPPSSTLSPFPQTNFDLINDVYVSGFNSWQTYEYYNFRPPGDINAVNFEIQLSFYFHNHKGRDYDEFVNLKAVPTVGASGWPLAGTVPPGKRVYVKVAATTQTYGMELQRNTEAEDSPRIVRPNDYHVISNPFQWIKIAEYDPDGTVPLVDRIMIDDVKLSIFTILPVLGGPGISLVDPPDKIIYEQIVSDQNESTFEDDVQNGDAPDIIGYNYIYNGFFKLADQTRTTNWARQGIVESKYLLDIYLNHLIAQGSQSLRLLSGSGIADTPIGFINSLQDYLDNRRYRFIRFAFNDKHGRFDIEIEETLTGEDGESPPAEGEFDTAYAPEEFTSEFDTV